MYRYYQFYRRESQLDERIVCIIMNARYTEDLEERRTLRVVPIMKNIRIDR